VFAIRLTKRAKRDFDDLPLGAQDKILSALQKLSRNPFLGKKLLGDLAGHYAFRAWPYRILYVADQRRTTVYVTTIGHRQGVYKKR
jgi:mRNA-degrading endonuclease RelE of RelBE toxin-antitoxin system